MMTHVHARARARDFALAAAVRVEITDCPARYTHRLIFFWVTLRGEKFSAAFRGSPDGGTEKLPEAAPEGRAP